MDNFIQKAQIEPLLKKYCQPDPGRVRTILEKALDLQRLELEETAMLLQVEEPELWEEIFQVAGQIKEKVYGSRVVIFAPLYCSNYCENDCQYCGFRRGNREVLRHQLDMEELKQEIRALIGLGHKRLVAVFGEHPVSGPSYIRQVTEKIYQIKAKIKTQ